MAIGKKTDFKIYDAQFYAGVYESITQQTAAFNAASAGAIVLQPKKIMGEFEKQSFLQQLSTGVSRRDPSAMTAVDDIALTQGEQIGVKLNRRWGPFAQAIDAWRKIGSDDKEMSLVLGRQYGTYKMRDMLNSALIALEACLEGATAVGSPAVNLNTDKSGTGTLLPNYLVDCQMPMGDNAQNIVCWVMHSKPAFNLLGQAILDKVPGVADVAIFKGNTGTLGKPVVVTDSPALFQSGTPNKYPVLGLVAGAVEVNESEEEEIATQPVLGLENLATRIQGEYAFNVKVKGAKYLTASGANPDDTALGTTTNWPIVAAEAKLCAGVRLLVQ